MYHHNPCGCNPGHYALNGLGNCFGVGCGPMGGLGVLDQAKMKKLVVLAAGGYLLYRLLSR